MPWNETCVMNEKRLFIDGWLQKTVDFTYLCERYGISRKTGYKWVERFREAGYAGLTDRSRARLTQDHRTADAIVEHHDAAGLEQPGTEIEIDEGIFKQVGSVDVDHIELFPVFDQTSECERGGFLDQGKVTAKPLGFDQ